MLALVLAIKGEHGMEGHDHATMMAAQAKASTTPGEIRETRFAGIKPDGLAIYLDAVIGAVGTDSDKELARASARCLREQCPRCPPPTLGRKSDKASTVFRSVSPENIAAANL